MRSWRCSRVETKYALGLISITANKNIFLKKGFGRSVTEFNEESVLTHFPLDGWEMKDHYSLLSKQGMGNNKKEGSAHMVPARKDLQMERLETANRLQ